MFNIKFEHLVLYFYQQRALVSSVSSGGKRFTNKKYLNSSIAKIGISLDKNRRVLDYLYKNLDLG